MSEQNITELLHPAFLARMREMLGDEYDSFIRSYDLPRTYALRVNTSKITSEEFEKLDPFPVTPMPWSPNGRTFWLHQHLCRQGDTCPPQGTLPGIFP